MYWVTVSIWATTALVAKCSDMIGHICTSGSEKSKTLSLVWKSKFCKFVQQSSVCEKGCTKNSPRYIFNKRKTRRRRSRPFRQIKQGLQIMLCNMKQADQCDSVSWCVQLVCNVSLCIKELNSKIDNWLHSDYTTWFLSLKHFKGSDITAFEMFQFPTTVSQCDCSMMQL